MRSQFGKIALRHALFLCILLFGSVYFGYYGAVRYPEESQEILKQIAGEFEKAGSLGAPALFLFIFGTNTAKAFLAMALGLFFGIVPLLFIFVNGFLIGMIGTLIAREEGLSTLLLGIAPHGIFELPGIILAAAYGLLLGGALFGKIRRKEAMRPKISFALKNFGLYIIPLLALAALIEVFLTAVLLEMAG